MANRADERHAANESFIPREPEPEHDGAGSDPTAAQLTSAFQKAIGIGVPLYNSGDQVGCTVEYKRAIARFVHVDESLAKALADCEGESTDPKPKAWILRDAMDACLSKIRAGSWEGVSVISAHAAYPRSCFGAGASMAALDHLARAAADREATIGELWRDDWSKRTLPADWDLEIGEVDPGASDGWRTYQYIHRRTGEEFSDMAPPGTITVCEHLQRTGHGELIGTPTHFVSFPFRMRFLDLVAAIKSAVVEFERKQTAYVWLDVLSVGHHNSPTAPKKGDASGSWTEEIRSGMLGMKKGGAVQVCTSWNDPERTKRIWMMMEAYIAVTCGVDLAYAMTTDEELKLADALRKEGPDVILGTVMLMETDPERGETSHRNDKQQLVEQMRQIAADSAHTTETMSEQLSNLTRKAFAGAANRHFQKRLLELPRADDGTLAMPADSSELAETLDLGHQLALLWANADDTSRSQQIFEQVLTILRELPSGWNGGAVARLDRSVAGLVKVLLRVDAEKAHEAEKKWLGGELAVSFEGVSIEFLANFVQQHNSELNFLSTDAVVERVIKPSSKRLSDTHLGKPFIETVHAGWKGKLKAKGGGRKSFFLSHAWRQTFHVAGVEWRGGAVQAILDSVPKEEHARTFVWFDIFCVNQHMVTAAYGGRSGSLYAFAFDPLRNAIAEADYVQVFMENYDDPAPLSRVWCLDELRQAILLGKEVKICMPKSQMETFRAQAVENPGQIRAEIDRIVNRVDIKEASATRPADRKAVLERVENTVGCDALNDFCRDIVRMALLEAAALDAGQVQRSNSTAPVLTRLLSKADALRREREEGRDPGGTPQEIEIRRAVGLMQGRMDGTASAGIEELRKARDLALRYYGHGAQVVGDLDVCIKMAGGGPSGA